MQPDLESQFTSLSISQSSNVDEEGGIAFYELPAEILVEILELLDPQDILRVRQVNKALRNVTYIAIVWIHLVERLGRRMPLSSPFPHREISREDGEALVLRALTVERNWRGVGTASVSIRPTHEYVYQARILPGGRYLVTATKDAHSRNAIVLWDMEHPRSQQLISVAKFNVENTVASMEAKYMKIRGRWSIVLLYVLAPHNGTTTYSTVCAPLELLDQISSLPFTDDFAARYSELPPAFTSIDKHRTASLVGSIALFAIQEPIYVLVYRPNRLIFHDLGNGKRGSLILPHSDPPNHYAIRGLSIVPEHNQILVVVFVFGPSHNEPHWLLDVFDIPAFEGSSPQCTQPVFHHTITCVCTEFSISSREKTRAGEAHTLFLIPRARTRQRPWLCGNYIVLQRNQLGGKDSGWTCDEVSMALTEHTTGVDFITPGRIETGQDRGIIFFENGIVVGITFRRAFPAVFNPAQPEVGLTLLRLKEGESMQMAEPELVAFDDASGKAVLTRVAEQPSVYVVDFGQRMV